jgi:hypothetical protein
MVFSINKFKKTPLNILITNDNFFNYFKRKYFWYIRSVSLHRMNSVNSFLTFMGPCIVSVF